jgi:hypothetical protein
MLVMSSAHREFLGSVLKVSDSPEQRTFLSVSAIKITSVAEAGNTGDPD